MEQSGKNKKYKCDDIPVIFFNFDSEEWEAKNKEVELSHFAAIYKNQLDEVDSRRAANSFAFYRSRTRRKEQEPEGQEKRRSTFPKGFSRFALIIIVLLGIWVWLTLR